MSTFYVLPSRHQLGRQFAEVLGAVFPGLPWPSLTWPDLAEVLGGTALAHLDVYVVFREDLPEALTPEQALAEACGAEAGDEVVEVTAGTRLTDANIRRWRLGQKAAA
jgi:hypothetical protein